MRSPPAKVPSHATPSLLSAVWRGARFGAKFTFWFLAVFVTLPISVQVVIRLATRRRAWEYIFFDSEGLLRFVFPALTVPVAGALLGAVVAAVLLPAASFLNGRGSSGRWEGYEPPSPFDDLPAAPRSREELLRRIVMTAPPDLAESA
jgi:hypothetical protein